MNTLIFRWPTKKKLKSVRDSFRFLIHFIGFQEQELQDPKGHSEHSYPQGQNLDHPSFRNISDGLKNSYSHTKYQDDSEEPYYDSYEFDDYDQYDCPYNSDAYYNEETVWDSEGNIHYGGKDY